MRKVIIALSLSVALALVAATAAGAIDIPTISCDGVNSPLCGSTTTSESVDTTIENVVKFLLWLIGILSVVMLIFGGFRYITSTGDASKLQSAKNTILYAVIGVVIAIFAYAIVNLVVTTSGA